MGLFDLAGEIVQRADGWLNELTGIGASVRKRGVSFVQEPRIDDARLTALYRGDGIAARIVDAMPSKACERRFTVDLGDRAADVECNAKLDELRAREKLLKTWVFTRLYGGAGAYVSVLDGLDPIEPIDFSKLWDVRSLTVLDRREMYVSKWHGEKPELYELMLSGPQDHLRRTVHASRVIRLPGPITPRDVVRANGGWDDSVLQKVYDRLRTLNSIYESSAEVALDASQSVYKTKGLDAKIAGDKKDIFRRRMEMLDAVRSAARAIILDTEEELERVETSVLGGFPELLDRAMILLAAASDGMPVEVLYGRQPSGLQATGEASITLWNDRVETGRENELRPAAEQLVQLLLRSKRGPTGGVEPAAWSIKFESLQRLNDLQKADLESKQAATDKMLLDAQVQTRDEWRQKLIASGRLVPLEKPEATQETVVPAVDVQATALNGAQTASLVDVATKAAARIISRESAAEIIQVSTPTVDPARALRMLGPEDFMPAGMGPPATVADERNSAPSLPSAETQEVLASITADVSERRLPRAAGIARIAHALGVDEAKAEALLGPEYYTALLPEHTRELDELRAAHAGLQRSHQSTKQFLARVLEHNRLGKLWSGIAGSGGSPMQADRADGATGVCVVLLVPPDVAGAVALPSGLPAADLHVALAYLGEGPLSAEAAVALRSVVAAWAASHAPVPGTLGGVGRFYAPEGEPDPVFLVPSCPALAAARQELVCALAAAGIECQTQHGWNPHVTLAYAPRGETPEGIVEHPVALTFTTAGLWAGETREEFPLSAQRNTPDLPVEPLEVLDARPAT